MDNAVYEQPMSIINVGLRTLHNRLAKHFQLKSQDQPPSELQIKINKIKKLARLLASKLCDQE
jgi:hypothetical protein